MVSVLVKPCEDISMNFVVGPPECGGFDVVSVVVDQVSKMRHCIPCHTTTDIVGLAKLLVGEVVGLHGLPATVVWIGDFSLF